MKKEYFKLYLSMALVFNSGALAFAQSEDAFEKQQQQERQNTFQGSVNVQGEQQYYDEVNPANIPNDPNYLDQSHPLQEAPLQENAIPSNPLPSNQIPENSLPENPI